MFNRGESASHSPVETGVAIVFAMTLFMLLFPKFLGWLDTLLHSQRRREQGGAVRLLVSVIAETLIGCLLAPSLMIFHSQFVWNTLRGRRVTWNRQNRDESELDLGTAWKNFGLLSLMGIVLTTAILVAGIPALYWFLPISVGWAAVVLLASITSQATLGTILSRFGLFLIPEETDVPKVVQYKRQAQELLKQPNRLPQPAILKNGAFSALHVDNGEARADSVFGVR